MGRSKRAIDLLYGVVNAAQSQFVVAGICLIPAVALLILGKACIKLRKCIVFSAAI